MVFIRAGEAELVNLGAYHPGDTGCGKGTREKEELVRNDTQEVTL